MIKSLSLSTLKTVIGVKGDTSEGLTVFSELASQSKQFTYTGLSYPSKGDDITVSSGTDSWLWGEYTTIVPENGITSDFVIDAISFSYLQSNYLYELQLYTGAANILACQVRPFKDGCDLFLLPTKTDIITANTKVSARLAWSGVLGARNAGINIKYHEC